MVPGHRAATNRAAPAPVIQEFCGEFEWDGTWRETYIASLAKKRGEDPLAGCASGVQLLERAALGLPVSATMLASECAPEGGSGAAGDAEEDAAGVQSLFVVQLLVLLRCCSFFLPPLHLCCVTIHCNPSKPQVMGAARRRAARSGEQPLKPLPSPQRAQPLPRAAARGASQTRQLPHPSPHARRQGLCTPSLGHQCRSLPPATSVSQWTGFTATCCIRCVRARAHACVCVCVCARARVCVCARTCQRTGGEGCALISCVVCMRERMCWRLFWLVVW